MISGLISTIFWAGSSATERSITAMRCATPICGAARPTPLAAYMDSNMSSTSLFSSGVSNSVTAAVCFSSTGSPNRTIEYVIRNLSPASEVFYLLLVAFKIPARLLQRVAAKLLQECLRQNDGDHRFADHTGGGHNATV